MPRTSAFIYELETKEKDIDNFIISIFKKLRIIINKELPWEGFLTKHNSPESIAYEKDELGALRFTYFIEEEEDFQSATGKLIKNRKKYVIPVWINSNSKLILIFTSNGGIAFKIVRRIVGSLKDKSLTITPCKFEIDFLKWLENVKDYEKSILLEIYGTKATNLDSVDGVANSLSLTTTSMLNKSQLFMPIKDKGNRIYLKGLFQIDSYQIEAVFYTNCKITISKKKSIGISMDEAKHSIKEVYGELKRWFNKYKKS